MKKHIFIAGAILVFALIFVYFNTQNPSEKESEPTNISTEPTPENKQQIEYIKITPEDAQRMEPVYLDVRTQEEYDDGHITGAVLLPVNEIEEKAQAVLPDKDQTIFVYCRTGIRSERAARALIEMGYTGISDLGGIAGWTGEIINSAGYVYYNYFGSLPEDEAVPFVYTTLGRISNGLWFSFTVEGEIVTSYSKHYDTERYSVDRRTAYISKLTITNTDGRFHQEFTDLYTENHLFLENGAYGLDFEDYNFDGYVDVALFKYPGGTSLNAPHYFWLWDNDAGIFVMNTDLESISDWGTVTVDNDNNQIISYSRGGWGHNITCYYEYINGEYILVKSRAADVELLSDEDDEEKEYIWLITIKELIDGEMKVTREYYEDFD